MIIIRSQVLGFCMGVRRTVEIAHTATHEANTGGKRVKPLAFITLGPLIHNPRVLAELKDEGIDTGEAFSPEKLPSDMSGIMCIIPAHGITPALQQAVTDRGGRLIDATCPYVKKNQLMAQKYEKDGVVLFIAGEAGHAEIEGILGYAPSAIIAGTPDEAVSAAQNLYNAKPDAQTALISQTTFSKQEYLLIEAGIREFFPDLQAVNTICTATTDRQDSLRQLVKKVDVVIIAGSADSANTRRLADIVREYDRLGAIVGDPSDIPPEFFYFETVGLCAGASTPDSAVDEIERALLSNDRVKEF